MNTNLPKLGSAREQLLAIAPDSRFTKQSFISFTPKAQPGSWRKSPAASLGSAYRVGQERGPWRSRNVQLGADANQRLGKSFSPGITSPALPAQQNANLGAAGFSLGFGGRTNNPPKANLPGSQIVRPPSQDSQGRFLAQSSRPAELNRRRHSQLSDLYRILTK